MNWISGRRSFLASLFAAGAGLASGGRLNAAGGMKPSAKKKIDGEKIIEITSGLGSSGNIYAELGLTPIINIGGTITVIGGSLMKPEVMELARMGNEHFVCIDDLEVAAGKFIAKLCNAPAGYTGLVTGGSASSIMIGWAGMMTEDFESRMEAIPDVTGFPRTEVIVQKQDRYPFDHQIRQTGAKLVEVATREEMIAAINPRTVGIHFCPQSHRGPVSAAETVAIAKAHGVYSFCDGGGSSDLPPKAHLWEYTAVGFDMVCFGGGKDISGPAGTGVLIGKENLVAWTLLNMSPQENRIGRTTKVGKEQIFALLKALEIFVNTDEDAMLRIYDERAQVITDAVAKLGVIAMPRAGSFGESLRYGWTWNAGEVGITGNAVLAQLAETKPVAIGFLFPADYAASQGLRGRPDPGSPVHHGAGSSAVHGNPYSLAFNTWVLKEGEDRIIADRLVEIFSAARV
jgi:seryl-tRNA(Sec) selenium transferase